MTAKTTMAVAAAAGILLSGAVRAQEQSNDTNAFDESIDYEQYLAGSDLRASELLGATVRNAEGEELGEIDDLIVSRDDDVITAVISVGGFLNIGEKQVGVPYEELRIAGSGPDLYLAATARELEAQESYEYETRQNAFEDRAAEERSAANRAAQDQGDQDRQAENDVAATQEPDVDTMDPGAHRASNLIGTTVVDSSGEEVGVVDDLVVSTQGRIEAVLSIGGLLGIGDRLIAVPLEELEIASAERSGDDEEMRVHIDRSASELMESNTEFQYDLRAAR